MCFSYMIGFILVFAGFDYENDKYPWWVSIVFWSLAAVVLITSEYLDEKRKK